MPCVARAVADGGFYLVLNRGNARADIFLDAADVEVFVHVVGEAQAIIRLTRDPSATRVG